MFIAHYNMANIKLIVDRNRLCILGNTENIVRLNPLGDKFKAFGFVVKEIDGHDYDQLNDVFSYMSTTPEVIIANTIKGKGVSYMEDKWEYHTIIPKDKELIKKGLEELS
jgi:transketolase